METEKEFRRRLAAAQNMAVRQRNYRRARDRALTRLAQKHKEEYLALLAKEKKKDEAQGKRWHNLAGANADSGLDISIYLDDEVRTIPTKVNKNKGNSK